MNPGHRYGEPAWAGDPSLPHTEAGLAMQIESDKSYEELRAAHYVPNPWRQFVLSQAVNKASKTKLGGLTDMITIIVGAPSVTWLIHQRPFLEVCGFVRSLLSGPFRSTNEPDQTIKLPYEDPATFDLFVNCVYSGHIGPATTEEALRLYTLAFRLQAPSICESILLAFQGQPTPFAPADVQYIMSNTTLSDPLRLRCLLQVCHSIVNSRIDPDSFIALEISNKYASEIVSFMIGRRNDIGTKSAANHFYTGIPFAIHVGRENASQYASSGASNSVSTSSAVQTAPTHPPPSRSTTPSNYKANTNPFRTLPAFSFISPITSTSIDSRQSRVSFGSEATRDSLPSSHANLDVGEIDTKQTPNARAMTSTSTVPAARRSIKPQPGDGNQGLGSQSTTTSSGSTRFTGLSGNFMLGSVTSKETLPKSPIPAIGTSTSAIVNSDTISSTASLSATQKPIGSTSFGGAQTEESTAPVYKAMSATVPKRLPKPEAIPAQNSQSTSTPALFNLSNSTASEDPGFLRTVLTASLNSSNNSSPVAAATPSHNALPSGQKEANVATNDEKPATVPKAVFKNK